MNFYICTEYTLYMQTCNIYKYVTFISMFIFSLNRPTVCRSEGICLQSKVKYTAIFDIKQNNVEAKGNVAFFRRG